MIYHLAYAFKMLSLILFASIIATIYITICTIVGIIPYGISAITMVFSIIIGLPWVIVSSIYLFWVYVRTRDIWQRMERLAAIAALPVERRGTSVVVSPLV